jgi:hypothetical protein
LAGTHVLFELFKAGRHFVLANTQLITAPKLLVMLDSPSSQLLTPVTTITDIWSNYCPTIGSLLTHNFTAMPPSLTALISSFQLLYIALNCTLTD